MFEKIGAYRHAGRHETKAEALTCLISAGLAALAQPVQVPPPDRLRQKTGLVRYAGTPSNGHDGRP